MGLFFSLVPDERRKKKFRSPLPRNFFLFTKFKFPENKLLQNMGCAKSKEVSKKSSSEKKKESKDSKGDKKPSLSDIPGMNMNQADGVANQTQNAQTSQNQQEAEQAQ